MLTYVRNERTNGRGGNPKMNLETNASRARKTSQSSSKPRAKPCRYCQATILTLPCADGRWRTFNSTIVPPGLNTWAWRRSRGMVDDSPIQGLELHYCAEYHRIDPHAAIAALADDA
jgi:hypothetical protein